MLLIALGDGGSGGDPENRASSLDTILGKMLRIDVLGAARRAATAIPADNPFVGRSDARPEILHYGPAQPVPRQHRPGHRQPVDRRRGPERVGGGRRRAGRGPRPRLRLAALGGPALLRTRRPGCDPAGVTMPVTEYAHGAGCSVIGGVVYRGDAIPALRGAYLFSDYCSGTLWAIDAGLDAVQAPITLARDGARDQLDRDGRGRRGVPDGPGGGDCSGWSPAADAGAGRAGRTRERPRRARPRWRPLDASDASGAPIPP